jgi:adenylate kinase family enzyme
MKVFNSHTTVVKNLQYFPRFPKTPKVVILGAPNVGTSTFAHRLAIDLGVPAVSMRDIYRNLLTFEDHYKTDTFYIKVIDLLKNYHSKSGEDIERINRELEDNFIPEKLLTLTKYTELGFVLYGYPNSIKQAEK